MAHYKVNIKNDKDFIRLLKDKDEGLVTAMVEGILFAAKAGLKKTELVEVSFNGRKGCVVTVVSKEYRNMLNTCLEDMIRFENYEMCAEIKKYLDAQESKDL